MTSTGKFDLEDSGLRCGPIDADPQGAIAELGLPMPHGFGGHGNIFAFANLSLADSVKLRDWLSERILTAVQAPERGSNKGRETTLRLFAGRLATTRRERGWTQRELAERAGVDRKIINMTENEIEWPSPDQISKIKAALGIRLQD